MEFMGITELAERSVEELSGGQRQRVFIALALAQQTDILFLDEPTTYLDIAYQVEILDLLRELNAKRGTTIVMVLHEINLSSRYADYLFAMKSGQLIFQGTPEEIVTPDNMRAIYGIDSVILDDPVSHSPFMVPVS
jgi:iron complex transport system ATP-binding protein